MKSQVQTKSPEVMTSYLIVQYESGVQPLSLLSYKPKWCKFAPN
jgi:hypothetical protein